MAEEFPVTWGRSILEPTRGHIREVHEGKPVTHDVQGSVVGMALCGTFLIDDLDPEVAATDFAKCSVCLQRLYDIRHADK